MKYLTKNKNWKIDKDYDINKTLYLLIDRPTCIDSFYHDFIWINNEGYLHRDYNLPTVINNSGNVSWYINDNLHRENNKPAMIQCDGLKRYYTNGKFIKKEK